MTAAIFFKKKWVAVLFLAIALAAGGWAKSKSAILGKLHDVRIRLRAAQKRLHEANVREHELSRQLHSAQINLHRATDSLNRTSVSLRHTELNLDFTKRRLTATEEELDVQKALISKRLNATFRNGKVLPIEFLLGAENYSNLLDRIYYLGLILNQDVALARSINDKKNRIAIQKTILANQSRELQGLEQKYANEHRVYASLTTKRQSLLGTVRTERQAYARNVIELEEISVSLEKELQDLIRREQARLGKTHHFTGVGALEWPVNTHLITSPFGWRMHPLFGRKLFHTGVDIGASRGSPIHAAADGVVIYSGWYGGYGNAVVIDHGGGLSTLYAHCSIIDVRQGQSIRQGQVIAAVGSTGNANGPHLHFEVRENGTAVDPMGKF